MAMRVQSGGVEDAAGPADEIGIRPMRKSDIPRVAEIERESFSMPWSEVTFRGLLGRDDSELVVATAGDRIVGHAVFWAVLDQGELGDIVIDPAWRGRGIGSRLIQAIFEHARRYRVRDLFLEVRESNRDAQRLYERHGFRPSGRRQGYYSDPAEDAVVMRKRL